MSEHNDQRSALIDRATEVALLETKLSQVNAELQHERQRAEAAEAKLAEVREALTPQRTDNDGDDVLTRLRNALDTGSTDG